MISKKDIKILDVIKKNCKLSTREISEKTGIPITTIHNRIKKLENEGIIKSYKAVIDNKKIGKNVQAFIQLTTNYRSQDYIAKKISAIPEVEECYILTGTTDVLIKVVATDVDQVNSLIIDGLKSIKGVQKTLTSIVLKEIAI